MNQPKISVIVAVYNTARWLPRCLDSLLAQTLQELEIIIINDASTDNSLDIIRQYERENPEKIRVIDSPINLRQGGARNLGIAVAEGEYIGFTDSDDFVEKTMYEELYNAAAKDGSDLSYCLLKKIYEDGSISDFSDFRPLPTGEITDSSRRMMLINHVTCIPLYIYNRKLLIDNNIHFPEQVRYEDIIIDPLVLLYAKKISAVRKPLYYYFIHSDSSTTSVSSSKYEEKLQVCRLIIEEYRKRGFYDRYRNEINYLFFRKGFIHTALNYITNSSHPDSSVVEAIRDNLLAIDPNYRKNPYYPGKPLFWALDRITSLNSDFLLKILQKTMKKTKRYV